MKIVNVFKVFNFLTIHVLLNVSSGTQETPLEFVYYLALQVKKTMVLVFVLYNALMDLKMMAETKAFVYLSILLVIFHIVTMDEEMCVYLFLQVALLVSNLTTESVF